MTQIWNLKFTKLTICLNIKPLNTSILWILNNKWCFVPVSLHPLGKWITSCSLSIWVRFKGLVYPTHPEGQAAKSLPPKIITAGHLLSHTEFHFVLFHSIPFIEPLAGLKCPQGQLNWHDIPSRERSRSANTTTSQCDHRRTIAKPVTRDCYYGLSYVQ